MSPLRARRRSTTSVASCCASAGGGGRARRASALRAPKHRVVSSSCGVRQLCDAYWAGSSQAVSDDGRFGDVELKITGRHGPTSWDAVVVRAPGDSPARTTALLRLQQPEEFNVGARVRVLDGALARDPEDDAAPSIVTLGATTEVYRVDSDPRLRRSRESSRGPSRMTATYACRGRPVAAALRTTLPARAGHSSRGMSP